MRSKTISILNLAVLLTLVILIIPATVNADPVQPVCSPWMYQYSYYECKNGDTYIIDVYKRKCGDTFETRSEAQLYVIGFCDTSP